MKRFLLCAALLLNAVHAPAAPRASGMAPPFALPDESGKIARLGDWRGRVVVLNFWAFWCNTWNAEMPHLRRLAARERSDGFKLVCVSVDATRVGQWQRQRGAAVAWPVLLDAGGRVTKAFGVAHVPTVVIIDAGGRIRATWESYPGNDAVLRAVAQVKRGEAVSVPRSYRAKKR